MMLWFISGELLAELGLVSSSGVLQSSRDENHLANLALCPKANVLDACLCLPGIWHMSFTCHMHDCVHW